VKEKRRGLGGPIAPRLEDDEERGPRSAAEPEQAAAAEPHWWGVVAHDGAPPVCGSAEESADQGDARMDEWIRSRQHSGDAL